ncbi:camp-dependent protein kinase catalytic subunit [Ascosphaera atra]|nr:camp-dependent protein kinase catalytic subunit [Ascosphaera atra]
MLTGGTPWDYYCKRFFEPLDPDAANRKVISGKIKYGRKYFTSEARKLISRFLVPAPEKRLGFADDDCQKVKSAAWFNGMDWEKLERRKIKPPHWARVDVQDQVSPFDVYRASCAVYGKPGRDVQQVQYPSDLVGRVLYPLEAETPADATADFRAGPHPPSLVPREMIDGQQDPAIRN